VALPLQAVEGGARLALEYKTAVTLMPGYSLSTIDTFVVVHPSDYFAPLNTYRQLMGERSVQAPHAPAESYESVWCAWGYERGFTIPLMEGAPSKAKELGLEGAVLDDGWQNSFGDRYLDLKKFPHGEADMKALVQTVRQGRHEAALVVRAAGGQSRHRTAAPSHRHAATRQGRRAAEHHLVEQLLPVPGLRQYAGLQPRRWYARFSASGTTSA